MGSRIAATIVLVVGLGALVWVAFGGDETDSVSDVTVSASPPSSGDTNDTGRSDDVASPEPAAIGVDGNSTDTDGATTAPQATAAEATAAEATATPTPVVASPENFGPRMDLVDIDGWLNTDATSIDDFNGKVLLVEMWTFGCFNCKARIPFNQSYYEEFAGENFEIVGVHAPEFSHEADVANIIEAAENLGVNWPIALDTDKKNFRAWQPGSTNFWPRTFVVDQNGDIRYDHIGEGKYEELRETIRFLIENPPLPKTNP